MEKLEFIDNCLRKITWGNLSNRLKSSEYDLIQSLLKNEKEKYSNSFKLIIEPNGHKYESGKTSSNFVTICKSPHWGSREGVMITGNIYDATKFEYFDSDAERILKYVKSRYPERNFKIIDIDKDFFGSNPRELWSDKNVKCDFDETGLINGTMVGLGKSGIDIDCLGFSTRVKNALLRKGYNTLGDLIDLNKDDYVKRIRGIGTKNYEEIKSKLKEYGVVIEE